MTFDISVITAVHPDKADHLDETYQSMLAQDGVDWQWCVVFDGPGVHWLEGLDDPRITTRRNPKNRGSAWTRNSAVLMAESELVRNLDADDYLLGTDSLAACAHNLRRPDVGFGVCAVLDQDRDGNQTPFVSRFTPYGEIPRHYWGNEWAARRYLDMRAHTLSFRQDLYWYCGGYRAMEFAEDVTLIVSMNEIASGWFEERPGSVYRSWDKQVSASPDRPWELEETYRRVVSALDYGRWMSSRPDA